MQNDDSKLFQEAVKGVTPLKHAPKVQHRKEPPKPVVRRYVEEKSSPFVQVEISQPVSPEQAINFSRHLPQKMLRKLRQGQYNAAAELDLHGYTVNDASYALHSFLDLSLSLGRRVVRIIHGKGPQAILKNHLNQWLRDCPAVLAFSSAKPIHGGTGALYVLLKYNNKEKK